jgi:transposase
MYSLTLLLKAEKSVSAKCEQEREKIEKELKKLYAEEFSCPCDAKKALERHVKKSKFHEVAGSEIEECKNSESKGRPR